LHVNDEEDLTEGKNQKRGVPLPGSKKSANAQWRRAKKNGRKKGTEFLRGLQAGKELGTDWKEQITVDRTRKSGGPKGEERRAGKVRNENLGESKKGKHTRTGHDAQGLWRGRMRVAETARA